MPRYEFTPDLENSEALICTDIKQCARKPCGARATCTEREGFGPGYPKGYTCSCADSWFVLDAATGTCNDINECTGNTHTCDTNAQCTNTIGGYVHHTV